MKSRRIFAGIITLGLLYKGSELMDAEKRFESVFNGVVKRKCCDREEYKKQLNNIFKSHDTHGILWINGKVSSGKTTLISHVLEEKKYVAVLNWREKTISSSDELSDALRQSF
jgi:polynucleotide 5'-kinase involved in rRNA processing